MAGVDLAYTTDTTIGAVAVLDPDSLSLVESQVAHLKTRFPYIPTLLSFREVSPAYSAIKKLQQQPDVFIIDGHGIAHPYGFGFATHLGLLIGCPTIGVAKGLLCGKVNAIGEQTWAPIMYRGRIVGAEVITKAGTKPIYVSIGNRISLKRALEIVGACTRTYRIPEPTRRAHIIATEEKRKN